MTTASARLRARKPECQGNAEPEPEPECIKRPMKRKQHIHAIPAVTIPAVGGFEYRVMSYAPPTRRNPPAGSSAAPAGERGLGFVPTAVTVRPSVGREVS